jgi:hypothetical protein
VAGSDPALSQMEMRQPLKDATGRFDEPEADLERAAG